MPTIKVVDFGMSKDVQKGASTNSVLGTPGYQAPEVVKGDDYTDKVDCFSLGCLAYILLCGYMPLYRNEGRANMELIFPDSEFESIGSDAKDFCKQLIRYDPNERMSAMDALAHPWLKSFVTGTMLQSTNATPSAVLRTSEFLKHPLDRKEQLQRIRSHSHVALDKPQMAQRLDRMKSSPMAVAKRGVRNTKSVAF